MYKRCITAGLVGLMVCLTVALPVSADILRTYMNAGEYLSVSVVAYGDYIAVDNNRVTPLDIFAITDTGNVVEIAQSGGVWQTPSLTASGDTNLYADIVGIGTWGIGGRFVASRADGTCEYWRKLGSWVKMADTDLFGSGVNIVRLADNHTDTLDIFGITDGGDIMHTYKDGTWTPSVVATGDTNPYVDIAALGTPIYGTPVVGDQLIAVRQDGSTECWYKSGGTWIHYTPDPFVGTNITRVAHNPQGTANHFAITDDGDLWQTYNSEDVWYEFEIWAGDYLDVEGIGGNDVVFISATSLTPGDVNGDGFVGGQDLMPILSNWGCNRKTRAQGDLNGDSLVGAADYTEVLTCWGSGTPPEPPAEPIPEPATLGLLVLGGLGVLLRRHSLRFRNRIAFVCVLAALLALMSGPRVGLAISSGDAGFGKIWTQSNPFVIMGTSPIWQDYANGPYVDQYWDTNHTFLIETNADPAIIKGWTEPYGKSWIRNIRTLVPADVDGALMNDLGVAGANFKAIKLLDEPSYAQITTLGGVAARIRGITKDQAVYVNLTASQTGDVDHLFSTVNPDMLMHDCYPFSSDGSTAIGPYMDALMGYRQKAQQYNVPYWAYLQSFGGLTEPDARESSESDMRMNVYSYLTAGYTGLQYFTQQRWPVDFDYSLVDENGVPDTMYYYAQDVNAEVQNLGQALRLLESTAVRFIPDQHAAPTGLTNWSAGAGGDTHITNVAIDSGQTGVGYRNGMIGVFDDYVGEKYFMLNNLDHAAGTLAAAASLDFTVTFDSSVNSLLRLNRETGVQEVVALTNHQLSTTLPGGTADLYKYNTGDFLLSVPQMKLELVEVTDPGAPVGYTAYDIVATTGTNLGLMELILDADAAGDIHQVSSDPANSTDPFDTYVTMPVTFNIFGAAVDIDPLASQVWDDDELNVTWTPAGGENSLPGVYQIVRIVLKNSASGTYTVKGWQTGGWAAVELSTSFGLAGDVNGDGFVGGGDLNAVLSNWGMAGARRSQGDLTGEGDVGGADYNQVLGNWGASASEPPGAIPEPATLGLLAVGGLLVLVRRHYGK